LFFLPFAFFFYQLVLLHDRIYLPKRFGVFMSPNIRDVAKRLDISITTVSRALDGYDDVADDTRDLVIQTAQKMGYSPNRAARQLRRQKAETIGFILPASAQRFDEPFFTEFISGLGEALSEQNFDLLVANAKTVEMERNLYLRWLQSHKVDGVVLNRIQQKDWRVQHLASAKFPFTALGRSQDGVDYPCMRVDGAQGYVELIQHLVEGGFSRLAFIGGHANLINHIDRLKWFKAALKTCKLSFDNRLVLSTDMTSAGGYETAKQLLVLPDPPDAILCVHDETAFGALHAAHEHGLAIGQELAIAGFDGVQDSRHTEPPLTTLDIPVPDIARQLAQMLLSKINGVPLETDEMIIRPKLLIRASTGGQ
jgi:LacI family transcriptional regulator